jgi:uroporphyrinogen-III decarboxylase
VYETVRRVKAALPPNVTLLGFCGAPWTVATYMIAGQGTPIRRRRACSLIGIRMRFAQLIDTLANASIEYLAGQLAAGVDAVQIFDTWAGVLPPAEFDRWCIAPVAKIVAGLRARVPGAKIIGFPRGAGTNLARYPEGTAVDAVGSTGWWHSMCPRGAAPPSGSGQSRSAGAASRRRGARPRRRRNPRSAGRRARSFSILGTVSCPTRRSPMSSRC